MATYKLSIWLDPTIVDEETANLYIESIKKHNNKISEWKKNHKNLQMKCDKINGIDFRGLNHLNMYTKKSHPRGPKKS